MLPRINLFSLLLLIASNSIVVGKQQTQIMQHLWEVDPSLGEIWTTEQTSPAVRIELEQLKLPAAQDRLRVAQSICLHHANPNFQQREKAIQLLVERLKAGESNLQVKRSMISAALCVGDASHAESIWSLAKTDPASAFAVELKLVQWKSSAAIQEWRQRVAASDAKPAELATALEGLAVVGNSQDSAALQKLILASHTSVANKYFASAALGELVTEGLNELAARVMDSDLEQKYLIAAHLLKRHSGANYEMQLRRIIADGPGAAKIVAYRSLVEQTPKLARELAKPMTMLEDSVLRTTAIQVLHRDSDDESLRIQGALLSDPHPDVRSLVANNLLEKAMLAQRAVVDELILSHLNSDAWTGIEKAIELAVKLEDRRYFKTFLQLLDHPRPEVNMHAAWALMELVQEPEILASMLVHADRLTDELKSPDYVVRANLATDQLRLSYLNEAFGKNRYQQANAMLLKFIPKKGHKLGVVSRASAIWALGKLNFRKDNQELRSKLYERMSDFESGFGSPEDLLVRFTCNLALGEMAHPEGRETIEQFAELLPSPITHAANWALAQIENVASNKAAK